MSLTDATTFSGSMYFRDMIDHFVFPQEWTVTLTFAAIALGDWTPEFCLLWHVSMVVISVKVVPAVEDSTTASWEVASEAEHSWISRRLWVANTSPRLLRSKGIGGTRWLK
jgi:hypothetical protein